MKKLILLAGLLFLLAGKWSAQTSVQSGPTDPTFCNPGAYFYNTTSQTYRQCGPTANTWAAAGSVGSINCAAAGSGANPSLVACSAAQEGAFSCSVTASTGTCVVSTTAVTANSRIFVQPSSAEGTNLSVTCNTTSDTGLTAPRLASKIAATSFTINLGTFATNPVCFNYWIVN